MHKIQVYALTICAGLIATIAPVSQPLYAQKLLIVKKSAYYRQRAKEDSLQKMVEIKRRVPSILYDLKYASAKNFTGVKLYKQDACTYLRLPVVKALERVQQDLLNKGYGLKIFDAYRPYSVTKKMWELIKDERYVANPAKGSGHNRGLAFDLTIVDVKTRKELEMGAAFDNFTDTAHHSFIQLDAKILANRKFLKETMMKHGFNPLETEWWHYSWPNDRNYDVLDLSFKELARLQQL